jgi:hypothetical protein
MWYVINITNIYPGSHSNEKPPEPEKPENDEKVG